MHDLIKIDSAPARLAVNFDEVKKALEKELERYDVVVTADTLADAKKLATELNKTKGLIATRRKEEVARASEPVKAFDAQMKELEGLCDAGRQKILDQVQRFEDETRDKARELLGNALDALNQKHGVAPEFQRARFDDLVLLTTVTKAGNLAAKAAGDLETRVLADKALQDRTRMRLLELENQSYKAGLSAPLTRDHVAGFLFADDAQYAAELQRIMDAEIQREEQAQRRMREQMEREQRERQEREQREQERAARLAASEQPQAQPEPLEPAPVAEAQETQPEPTAVAPAATTAAPGKVAITVTATFHTSVSETTPDEAIKAELRRVMEKAGITTLAEIRIERKARKAA